MSNAQNWPQGTDYSSTNWTGRVQRTSDWGGNWAPSSNRIPLAAWIGAAAFVGLLFVIVPVLGRIAGF